LRPLVFLTKAEGRDMLDQAKELKNYTLRTLDGEIGKVKDFDSMITGEPFPVEKLRLVAQSDHRRRRDKPELGLGHQQRPAASECENLNCQNARLTTTSSSKTKV
jgi:hypothetical protein